MTFSFIARFGDWPALTPALSPRRGSAKFTFALTKPAAAFVASSDAESRPVIDFAIVALPLPGGEGRVEGGPSSFHGVGLGNASELGSWNLDLAQ
jgi:hypothetical protein